MTTSWGSLYSHSDKPEAVAAALRESLTALGYQLYDPFGLLPGKAYPQTVRLFVAPALNGWTRVIGVPDNAMLPQVSQVALCLSVVLNDEGATLDTYRNGERVALADALAPYSTEPDKLVRALRGDVGDLPVIEEPSSSVFDALAGDAGMQALAAKVDPKQAEKMFERISGGLMNRAGSDAQATQQAQSLVNAPEPDWNSAGGQQIRAVLACLNLPWREPTLTALRDAYQLHNRRQRNPNARLYPGDEDAMKRVPNALDYVPVYGGRAAR